MATAAGYFALSVCAGGTRGCSYELGSGVRQNSGLIQAPKQVSGV